MTHHVLEVDGAEAKRKLVETLASGTERSVLFLRTKHAARKLARQLTEAGIPAVDLHGNLSQAARDRNLAAFSAGDVRVLVATDVAARGVHVDDIDLVVHVDPPTEHKSYLHRSGRTARAGKTGDVVTVVLPEQRRDVRDLLRKAAIAVTPQAASESAAKIAELVGIAAAYVTPSAQPASQQQGGGRSQGANAQRKRAVRDGQPAAAGRGGRSRGTGAGAPARSAAPRRSGSSTSYSTSTGSGAASGYGAGSASGYSAGSGSTGGARSNRRASSAR
jgi:superfamily II DNA/RNA helicase